MTVAVFVRKHEDVHPQLLRLPWLGKYSVRGALADATAGAYLAICVKVGLLNNQYYLGHYEYLTGHMAAIFFALFLYGSIERRLVRWVDRSRAEEPSARRARRVRLCHLPPLRPSPWSWYGFNRLFEACLEGSNDLFDNQTHQPLAKRDVLKLASLIAVSAVRTELFEKPLVSGILEWLKRMLLDSTLK